MYKRLMERFSADSFSGAKLNIYQAMPTNRPKAVVHISHGMAEHAKRYAWFMQVMRESGYAVYAHDIRGHGYTYAKNSSKGHFADKNGFDQLLHDLDFVIDLMKQDHPNIPIFCFGHSLGSILLFRYVTHAYHRINGIACWNSGIETNLLAMIGRIILSTERKFLHPKKRSNFAWILTFQSWANKIKNKRTNFDWLSHDKAQVDKYIDDKLCGFDVSLQSWLDIAEAVFYSNQNLSNIPANFPIHLLGGGKDPCTNYGKDMEKLAAKLKRNGHSNHILNTISESRHETLNELKRDKYAHILLEWLNSQLNKM